MDNEFWKTRWKQGETPWDRNEPHSFIQRLPQILRAFRRSYKRVLVPGCGNGQDALGCSEWADEVVAFDLSHVAIDRAKELSKEKPQVGLLVHDFMAPKPIGWDHGFDVIFDYAVFCALDDETLGGYVNFVRESIHTEGVFVLLGFEKTQDGVVGPPFQRSLVQCQKLLSDKFTLLDATPVQVPAHTEIIESIMASFWMPRQN